MIRKSVKGFSEKIMPQQGPAAADTGKLRCTGPIKIDRFKIDRSDQRLREPAGAKYPRVGPKHGRQRTRDATPPALCPHEALGPHFERREDFRERECRRDRMHPGRLLRRGRLPAAEGLHCAAGPLRRALWHHAQALPRGLETRPAHGRRVLKKDPAGGGASDLASTYRPLGLAGPSVDPLGDVFIRLLPGAFCELFAPALGPPALEFA